jgi:hypothetical protein
MPKKTADSMVKKEVVEKTVTNKGKKGKGAADVPTSVTAGKVLRFLHSASLLCRFSYFS